MFPSHSLPRVATLLLWAALAAYSPGAQSGPQLVNTALAGADWKGSAAGPRGAVIPVDEAAQAGTDLNLDGDVLDAVPFLLLPAGAAPLSIGVSCSDSVAPLLVQRRIAFLVREGDEAGGDLNGDGDASDRVIHRLDLR